jgi:hypothetical protein
MTVMLLLPEAVEIRGDKVVLLIVCCIRDPQELATSQCSPGLKAGSNPTLGTLSPLSTGVMSERAPCFEPECSSVAYGIQTYKLLSYVPTAGGCVADTCSWF